MGLTCLVGCANATSSGSAWTAGDAGLDARVHDATVPDVAQDDGSDDVEVGPSDGAAEAETGGSPLDAPAVAPEAGGPQPVVLASDVPNPSYIVTDGQYLYWTDFVVTDGGATLGRVMRMPVDGGAEMPVATQTGAVPSGLAVDGTNVYWVDDHATLFSAPRGGGAPQPLYDAAAPGRIATDGQYVYLAVNPGAVAASVPVDGGSVVLLTPLDAGYAPVGIAIDATRVYFAAPAAGAIVAVSKDGGGFAALARNGEAGAGAYVSDTIYQNVAVSGAGVYWTLMPGGPVSGSVLAAAPDGGAPVLVYRAGAATPLSVVADDTSVYFLTTGSAPSLLRVPVDGGPAVTLAINQFSAAITGDPGPTVAIDGARVYWLSPPQILTIAK